MVAGALEGDFAIGERGGLCQQTIRRRQPARQLARRDFRDTPANDIASLCPQQAFAGLIYQTITPGFGLADRHQRGRMLYQRAGEKARALRRLRVITRQPPPHIHRRAHAEIAPLLGEDRP